jgi:glycosyltransferase involved in cell wall biosynthesis
MEENNLKELAKNLELSNISFIPPVPKNQVQEILKLCKVCYISSKKEKIYKYGISPNKIFDYMYSEKPILLSYSGEADLIKQANCGITVEAENPESIANAILKLYNMPEEQRNALGKNGKEYVLKYHTFEKITDKFEEILICLLDF